MSDIWRMIGRRLLLGLLTLFIISVVIFGATELLPGDLARELLGQSATEETLAALREQLGLNDPAPLRYWNWLTDVLQGDLGVSMATQKPISELVGTRLGNTLFLALYAAALSVPLSLLLGVLAALWRNSVFDRASNALALTAISFPEFFVAYILVLWLAQTGLFPSMVRITGATTTLDLLYMSFLPALTLTLVVTAHMMRMTRAAIINLLASPYIEMARLKGLSPMRVVLLHAVPNALAPDHQRGGAEPCLSDNRCCRGRSGVCLSGPWSVDDRRGDEPRHRSCTGHRTDLCGGLCSSQPSRGYTIDDHQPAPDAQEVGL